MSSITRSLALSVDSDLAFALLTDSSSVATIFSAQKAFVSPQEGGEFEIYFDDDDSTKGCKILEIDPCSKLVFEFKGPTKHRPFGFVQNTITFSVVEQDGKANVDICHDGFKDGNDWDNAKEYFEENWDRWVHNLQVMAFATEQDDLELSEELLSAVAGGRGGWRKMFQMMQSRRKPTRNILSNKYSLTNLKLSALPQGISRGGTKMATVADQA